jgi:hypothetical protein
MHSSGLKDSFRENDGVALDLKMGKRELNAGNVKLVR